MVSIRATASPRDIDAAARIDRDITGTTARIPYIENLAAKGGLSVVIEGQQIVAFCCLDHNYFFERPFISLLMVDPKFQRCGFGTSLLQSIETEPHPEIWTSTNLSNAPMRALLRSNAYRQCGQIEGLDNGDPEVFFMKTI